MISLPLENEQRKTCATHLHHLFKRKHLPSSFSISLSWGQVADVGVGASVEHVDKNYPLGGWMMSSKSHLPTLDTPFASGRLCEKNKLCLAEFTAFSWIPLLQQFSLNLNYFIRAHLEVTCQMNVFVQICLRFSYNS